MYYKIMTAESRYSYGKVLYASNAPERAQWIKEPKLILESNSAGSLSFTISEKKWKKFTLNFMVSKLYVVRVRDDSEEIIWSGRLLDEERDSYNNRFLTYEGAFAYFHDTIQPKFRCSNVDVSTMEGKEDVVVDGSICHWSSNTDMAMYLRRIIDCHNQFISGDQSRQILAGDISYCQKIQEELISEIDGQDWMFHVYELDGESTFETISGKLLNKYGGEMRVRYEIKHDIVTAYLDYIDAYSSSRQMARQQLKFGRNIVDISRSAAGADFATVLVPYGRSLSDAEKSWTMIENAPGYDSIVYLIDQETVSGIGYSILQSYYIDKDGKNTALSSTDNNYAVFGSLEVSPGDRYFVTQTIPSLAAVEDGMLSYAMFKVDENGSWILVQAGPSVKSNKDPETEVIEEVTYIVTDYEITIPEGVDHIKFAMYNPSATTFRVKKFNPHYQEEYLTIFDVETIAPSSTEACQKEGHGMENTQWNLAAFPRFTDSYDRTLAIMAYKKIAHHALFEEFGAIEMTVEFNYASSLENLLFWSKKTLDKMTAYIKTEIEAVDLAWIDDSNVPYDLLDYVKITSAPHDLGVDEVFALPIRKIELNFQDVASSRVWASNEVETRDGEPTYMSAYMSKVYKG